jgi:ABC-type transport system substrate-binding protein
VFVVAVALLGGVVAAGAQETPRHGGTLVFSVGAEPAALDGHREDSFATVPPMAPFYSLLIKVNQDKPYDRIVATPGVVSLRQAQYTMVDRVEAPDPRTVVFRLK